MFQEKKINNLIDRLGVFFPTILTNDVVIKLKQSLKSSNKIDEITEMELYGLLKSGNTEILVNYLKMLNVEVDYKSEQIDQSKMPVSIDETVKERFRPENDKLIEEQQDITLTKQKVKKLGTYPNVNKAGFADAVVLAFVSGLVGSSFLLGIINLMK